MKIISHDTQNLVKPPQDPPNKLDYFKKTFVNQSLRSWKFFIGEGNNGEIVRRIINETRGGWWREAKEIKGIINFKWQQNTREFKYERMTANALYKQIVNHFEFHREISTKAGLVKNLKSYCQVKNLFFLNFDFFFFLPKKKKKFYFFFYKRFLNTFFINLKKKKKKKKFLTKKIFFFLEKPTEPK